VDFKVAFELPLFGKSALMGDIKINNLFNHQRRLTWVADSSSTPIDIGGHYAVDNPTAYGTSTSPDYFASPRSVAATIGLKF